MSIYTQKTERDTHTISTYVYIFLFFARCSHCVLSGGVGALKVQAFWHSGFGLRVDQALPQTQPSLNPEP